LVIKIREIRIILFNPCSGIVGSFLAPTTVIIGLFKKVLDCIYQITDLDKSFLINNDNVNVNVSVIVNVNVKVLGNFIN